jgi:hypothetical protein
MTDRDPVETAWRIHAALCDWTGKVDTKASFALTIESAVLGGVAALSVSGHRFNHLKGFWTQATFWAGVAALGLAALASISVVMPRTRRRHLDNEWRHNFIYFGHLKEWSPAELADYMRKEDPLLTLSRQLVNMSKIAWAKHARVRQSLLLATLGAALIALSGFLA